MTHFNPDMLSIARNFRGLSQTELIAGMGQSITQASLSKIESGDLKPSDEVIQNLSNALHFPIRFFEHIEKLNALPISLHAYRKKSSTTAKALSRMNAEMMLKMGHVQTLELLTNVPKRKNSLPTFKIGIDVNTPQEAAKKLRSLWVLGNEPLENLTATVEDAGVLVFLCDFKDNNVDGVSLKMHGVSPCVFLNANQPNDRIRFTLAHELGHLVLHRHIQRTTDRDRHKLMEKQAHHFAGAFLLPAETFASEVRMPVTLDDLLLLKRRWGVSVAAITMRLHALGLLDEDGKLALFKRRSARWGGKSEPGDGDRKPEQPRLLRRTVDLLVDENVMPLDAIPRHIGLAAFDIEMLAGLPEGFFQGKSNIVQFARLRTVQTNAEERVGHDSTVVLPFRTPSKT